ncbi:MAG: chromosome segregation protein SMC [Betaproteobacteria bacterium]|nr:chromosome segregation protein SMC [Betaproteobacteria bacterium]
MRLTHIKLAGFKSFVDPTHIALPGQLVGVVGPNGCGKSNVIDAVRWVLGESSARHLRGETMQDVIFNGSGDRKPVNRASVELVFDNSLGKAAGPWSQYGEISIKRVLERHGDSSYYINNIAVRRRDVADIFLGTGLGARAYAIIEQGMISRIVESKPEELRVFLEEAAGISKYRERRKETENRLGDARENLQRVEDIRRELEGQITRLEEQAAAAERYRALEASIRHNQCLLWALRRRDAGNQRARLANDIERGVLELEKVTTELRAVEASLEQRRSDHFAAGDRVHGAQGELYEANAEFARIEQQLQYLRSNRQRAMSRKTELDEQIARDESRVDQLEISIAEMSAELAAAAETLAENELQCDDARQAMPEAEQSHRESRMRLDEARQALGVVLREREVSVARREQTDRVVQQLRARRERLRVELETVGEPDEDALARLRAEGEGIDDELAAAREGLAVVESEIPSLEDMFREASAAVESLRHQLASLEARRHALIALQDQVGSSEQMASWLGQHGLDGASRLWERVQVASGWEDAVEAVLRERLNAIAVEDVGRLGDWFGASPPGKLTAYRAGAASGGGAEPPPGCTRLTDHVSCSDPAVAGVLAEWLAGVFAVDEAGTALAASRELGAGQLIVSREGHAFTGHSVGFHASDSEIHGLLERKREIDSLEGEVAAMTAELSGQRERQQDLELRLEEMRESRDRMREELSGLRQRRHEVEISLVRATEIADRARQRRSQIEGELAEIESEEMREREAHEETVVRIAEAESRSGGLQADLEQFEQAFAAAEEHLGRCRERRMETERLLQQAQFAVRGLETRLADARHACDEMRTQIERGRDALATTGEEVESFDETPLEEQVGAALDRKRERESVLAQARDALSEAERVLRDTDEKRSTLERQLEPLRSRLGDLRLKEQEARLAEENFAQQLAEAHADEAALASAMEGAPRPGTLQGEINRLQEELTGLGAVNLAALDELGKTTERKSYLDAQSEDLTTAVTTLEDAIRRIDRETRERLKETFDTVNANLSEMFPQLFGGGEATLVMTGEEILDSGVQIVARPPGKRNTSIHLLSGGEKALTAVSLVFSLFRLNPAPFCLLDEVDAPLDDSNTGRFCGLVRKMSEQTQFIFISHNKITMEMAEQLVGVTMPELGVSRIVAVDIDEAMKMREEQAA